MNLNWPDQCAMEEAIIPDDFVLNSTGLYKQRDTLEPRQLSQTPFWIAETVLHLNTMMVCATIAFRRQDEQVNHLVVPIDTFESFGLTRLRFLQQANINLQNWAFIAVLQYLRYSYLNCPVSYVVDDIEDDHNDTANAAAH